MLLSFRSEKNSSSELIKQTLHFSGNQSRTILEGFERNLRYTEIFINKFYEVLQNCCLPVEARKIHGPEEGFPGLKILVSESSRPFSADFMLKKKYKTSITVLLTFVTDVK